MRCLRRVRSEAWRLGGGGIGQFGPGLRRHGEAGRGGLRFDGFGRGLESGGRVECGGRRNGGLRHRGLRRRANRAQIAFDHGEAIDHMTEGGVHRLQRILGVTVGLRLAVADVRQLALEQLGQRGVVPRVRHRHRLLPDVGKRSERGVLALQMAQDVRKRVLDARQVVVAAAGIVGGFKPLQQIRHALFEMCEGGRTVIADLHAVDAVGQPTQRAFERFRIALGDRRRAAFQRVRQCGDAVLQHGKGIVVVAGMDQLVDLGRQRVDVVGQPHQRVVGGDVGDDGAQRRDRAFELLHGARIVVGAQDHVELGAEIADRIVVAGKLLGRHQRAQHLADFGERALDAVERIAVDRALAVVVDAARQRADFALQRLDRAARHRLGDGGANFRKLAAEGGDRLLEMIGTLQRVDLARDLEQVPLQCREIRARSRGRRRHHGRDRRRLALRHRSRRRRIELALACGDFRDRGIERGGAQGRRGPIGGRGLGCLRKPLRGRAVRRRAL